jgi:hypothetical protein
MEYPHWLMIAGAVLVAFGFAGFAFSQNKNESESRERLNARNKVARSAEEVASLAEQESRKAPSLPWIGKSRPSPLGIATREPFSGA